MEHWEASWNRDVLERIVALLFSLANLADLAANAPFLRRRQVLGILSHGEAEARAFVMAVASGTPVSTDALEFTLDAARLAVRLRALALMLCFLLAQAPPSALSGKVGPRAGQPSPTFSRPTVHLLGTSASPAPDTS